MTLTSIGGWQEPSWRQGSNNAVVVRKVIRCLYHQQEGEIKLQTVASTFCSVPIRYDVRFRKLRRVALNRGTILKEEQSRATKTGRRFDVTVAGELNLDLILYGLPEELPGDRELLASGMMLTLGSSSAIVAHNLAALGNHRGRSVGSDRA